MSEDRYPFAEVEQKWVKWWNDNNIHDVDLDDPEGIAKYILVMFSYPSTSKLHIGHWWNYGPTDSYARYMKMQGVKVFEPMGFDSFGLPAENYAIKVNSHPKAVTENSIVSITDQLKAIGAMYDWRYEVVTSRPEYYKWTQWLFLKLYEHGLAYQKDGLVNWCTSCQTVLANEQVLVDGSCERCGSSVQQRKMKQWYFKITEYAEKLLDGLKGLDWPESTIKRQENWIGKSEGATIKFPIENHPKETIDVFTTRPDTLYGVTYVVIAPESDLVEQMTTPGQKDKVDYYVQISLRASEVDRTSTTREKSGVFTGSYVIHPLTGDKVEVWVGDYVLGSYGTGAVMAVPAHDQRDFEFAKKYDCPLRVVVRPPDNILEEEDMYEAYCEPGIMANSGDFSGINSEKGKKLITKKLEEIGAGSGSINYRLRDWSMSRQRYWGCPIPIVECDHCGMVPVPEDQLPLELPEKIKEFKPKGQSPLSAVEEWITTKCPKCGEPAKRYPDTMDTFVDSSFYHLRYLAADSRDKAFNMERMKRWLPIDTYVGGPEHGTGHLIYFRFITRFLNEIGECPVAEPVKRLIHQGLITKDGHKMSKSKGNVVNPDKFVERYGSDVFRMYLMFTGDYKLGGDWSDEGITGIDRFVNRAWRLVTRYADESSHTGEPEAKDYSEELFRVLHNTIKSVGDDLSTFSFNTAISRMMELVNELYRWVGEEGSDLDSKVDRGAANRIVASLVKMMAPVAPHFAEEAWKRFGSKETVFKTSWPVYSEEAMVRKTVTLILQVNGKIRDKIEAPADADKKSLEEMALNSPKVQKFLDGKTIRKVIVVPGKLVNIAVS